MNVEKGGRGLSRKTQQRLRSMERTVKALTKKITQARTKEYTLDTHDLRKTMIMQLETLFEMAASNAINCHPKKSKEKQNWVRIAGYIAQVINSLGKTYDLKKLEGELDDLATMLSKISEEMSEQSRKPHVE